MCTTDLCAKSMLPTGRLFSLLPTLDSWVSLNRHQRHCACRLLNVNKLSRRERKNQKESTRDNYSEKLLVTLFRFLHIWTGARESDRNNTVLTAAFSCQSTVMILVASNLFPTINSQTLQSPMYSLYQLLTSTVSTKLQRFVAAQHCLENNRFCIEKKKTVIDSYR